MISAISTSLSGLKSATQRLNLAAERIVTSAEFNLSNQENGSRQTITTTQSGGPIRVSSNPFPDFTSSLVDLKLAEFSYKASAKVLKTALEINKNLIDQIR